MDAEALGQWAAVVIALIAAGVVAWQSWETRKSARASQDAVRVANQALDLSRELAAESLRARIDADMPALSVTFDGWRHDGPLRRAVFDAPTMDAAREPVEPGWGYRLPRDAHTLVFVRGTATVHNDSDRHVSVTVGHLPDSGPPTEDQVVLPPGASYQVMFSVCRTVQGWIDGDITYPSGSGTESTVILSAGFEHPADQSANEGWSVGVAGSPLTEVDSATLRYQPSNLDGMRVRVLRHRDYWRSKSKEELLP